MSTSSIDVSWMVLLTASVVLHVSVEMILGTKWCILFTAFPATNKCAVRCFRRHQSASMIFDVVVQILNGSKDTITRTRISSAAAQELKCAENSPSDFIIPPAHGNIIQVSRSLFLANLCLDGRRGTGGNRLTCRREL